MRLAISMRGLEKGSYAIRTILLYLTKEIIEIAGQKHEIFLYFNTSVHYKEFSAIHNKRVFQCQNRFVWDHFGLPIMLKKDRIDLALFMKGTMPFFLPCKGAVIFHALRPE